MIADGALDHRRLVACRTASRCDQPRMAFSGVRSSCDSVAEELVLQPVDRLRLERGRACSLSSSTSRSAFDALAAPRPRRAATRSPSASSRVRARRAPPAPRERAAAPAPAASSASRLLIQLDEDRDLRVEHLRDERLEQVVDRADRVAAEDVRVAAVVRGQEDDRRLPRALARRGSARPSRSRRGPASRRRAGSARSRACSTSLSAARPEFAAHEVVGRYRAGSPRARAGSPGGRRRAGCRPAASCPRCPPTSVTRCSADLRAAAARSRPPSPRAPPRHGARTRRSPDPGRWRGRRAP